MSMTTTQCCLCGLVIEENAHKLDPCGLYIISKIMEEDDKQSENLFFCHFVCIRGAIEPGTRTHLVLDQVTE